MSNKDLYYAAQVRANSSNPALTRSYAEIQKLEAFKKEALGYLNLALSFAPKEKPPKVLCPSFYHTLRYEDECKLQDKIDSAREFLFKHGDKVEQR